MASKSPRLALLLTTLCIDHAVVSFLGVLRECGLGVDSIEVVTVLHVMYLYKRINYNKYH